MHHSFYKLDQNLDFVDYWSLDVKMVSKVDLGYFLLNEKWAIFETEDSGYFAKNLLNGEEQVKLVNFNGEKVDGQKMQNLADQLG